MRLPRCSLHFARNRMTPSVANVHGNRSFSRASVLGPVHMHKIYTCKYFAILSKYTHISKSIFNLRSHANSVHISILQVTLDQLYFDSSHVQTVS